MSTFQHNFRHICNFILKARLYWLNKAFSELDKEYNFNSLDRTTFLELAFKIKMQKLEKLQ